LVLFGIFTLKSTNGLCDESTKYLYVQIKSLGRKGLMSFLVNSINKKAYCSQSRNSSQKFIKIFQIFKFSLTLALDKQLYLASGGDRPTISASGKVSFNILSTSAADISEIGYVFPR